MTTTPATDAMEALILALEPFNLLATGVNMNDPLGKWFTMAQFQAARDAIDAALTAPGPASAVVDELRETLRLLRADLAEENADLHAQRIAVIDDVLTNTVPARSYGEGIETAAGMVAARAAQFEADEADFKAREKWDMRALVGGKAIVCREIEAAIRALNTPDSQPEQSS